MSKCAIFAEFSFLRELQRVPRVGERLPLRHRRRRRRPQLPHELNIGDGHFATCPAFSTPAQKTGGRQLTLREQIWNQWVQLVRSRVEHLNTVIKQHQMFKGEPYRGWMKNLACFVKVTLHATAVEIRKREERDGPRYAGYGWWPHQ